MSALAIVIFLFSSATFGSFPAGDLAEVDAGEDVGSQFFRSASTLSRL